MLGRWVVTHKAPVVLVRGLRAGDRLRAWGLKPLWSEVGHGWVVDDRHLADVLACAEHDRIQYRTEEVDPWAGSR